MLKHIANELVKLVQNSLYSILKLGEFCAISNKVFHRHVMNDVKDILIQYFVFNVFKVNNTHESMYMIVQFIK